jgi:nucleoside-diphosphate-sugar epimerase
VFTKPGHAQNAINTLLSRHGTNSIKKTKGWRNKIKNYLVTGAAGFIGSHIVKRLLDDGNSVIGFDNNREYEDPTFSCLLPSSKHEFPIKNENFIKYRGDLRNKNDLLEVTNNIDYVLHLGALISVPKSMEQPDLYFENNVKGTINLLEACRDQGVKRVVFSSSSSVYGNTATLPTKEEYGTNPQSNYAMNKLYGEFFCHNFFHELELETVILRYFNVYGPGQNPMSEYAAVISSFIDKFARGVAPTIYGDGEQTRDFIYIDDVVEANIRACEATNDFLAKPINIGSGHAISINELAEIIKQITGSDLELKYDSPRRGDVKHTIADISRAKEYLGMNNMTGLVTGLQNTLKWAKTPADFMVLKK